MPNRIIKESAFESDKIASLSDFEFRLWVGLITQADDAGRGDARPAIIKGRVFALRDKTTAKDIDNALHALEAAGCINIYNVGGRPYFMFPSWADHQRVRDVKPKYPGPEETDKKYRVSDSLPQIAANCGEQPQTAADCRLNPIQSNTIQSVSESISESESRLESVKEKSKKESQSEPTTAEQINDIFNRFAGYDDELALALQSFAEMRKAIKKPLTVNAANLVCKKLKDFPQSDWIEIINQSIMNSWQGIFPLNHGHGNGEQKYGRREREASIERSDRLIREGAFQE